MRAGQLRNRITLQSATPSGVGNTATWADVADVYSRIEPVNGAAAFSGELPQLVTMRYRAGVSTSMRIKYGSRVLWIDSVMNLEQRNRELQLECREYVWSAAVAFSRGAQQYNDSDGSFSGAKLDATSRALERAGDPDRLAALGLRQIESISVLIDAEPLGTFVPTADDSMIFAGLTSVVKDVRQVGPDGLAIAYLVTGEI